jgi:hypothetical protein
LDGWDDEDGDEDGDDGADDALDGDGDIKNQGQYAQLLGRARSMREDDADGDGDIDPDSNFLGSDDFVTPLDDINVWAKLVESLQTAGAALVVDPAIQSAIWDTASLASRCDELRKMPAPGHK